MDKTSIRDLIKAHPELLDADTYVVIHKSGNDVRLSVAGSRLDIFEMIAGATNTLLNDSECPGCPHCQNGKTH